MAKKSSWFGTITSKIVAVALSALTGLAGMLLSEFWTVAQKGKIPTKDELRDIEQRVVGTLMSRQKGSTFSSSMLGTEMQDEGDRITVVAVPAGSPGAMLGLMPGDLIETVNRHAIHSPSELDASLAESRLLFANAIVVHRGAVVLQGETQMNSEKRLVVRRQLAPR